MIELRVKIFITALPLNRSDCDSNSGTLTIAPLNLHNHGTLNSTPMNFHKPRHGNLRDTEIE